MNFNIGLSTEVIDIEAALIRRLTMCDFSHVFFYRKVDGWTFSAMNDGKGVTWRPPNPRAKILLLDHPRVDDMALWAFTQQGKPYDQKTIAGFIFNRDWKNPAALDCNELIFLSAINIGAPLLNHTFIPLEHTTPRDVLLSPSITLVA